jgi:hypothetical protein
MMTASVDYIYIIVLLVFALLGGLTGQNKKKKSDTSSDKPVIPTNHSPLPEAWKDLLPHEQSISKPVKQVSKKKVNVEKPFLDTKEEGQQSVVILEENKNKEDQSENEYAFKDIDDVRKGIIWSEILHRKY